MPPLIALPTILIYFLAAAAVAYWGRRRKWGYWGYFWSSILFTPFLGVMFVLAADPPPKKRRGESAR